MTRVYNFGVSTPMTAQKNGDVDTDRSTLTISPSSKMTLGLVASLMTVCVGGYVSFQSLRDEVRTIGATAQIEQMRQSAAVTGQIRDVADAVREMRSELTLKTDDRWRKSDMKAWALTLRAQNQTLAIPDVQ